MRTMLGAALLSLLGGCGGSEGEATRSAAVSLTVSPNPIQEGPCPAAHCGTLANQNEAAGSLRVTETGGVGLGLTSVAMTLRRDASGVVVAAGQLDAAVISQLAGTARVEANGALNVPVAVHYDTAAGGQPSTLTLALSGTDDNGNPLTRTTTVPVTP
jgi:hypothetical protein